MQITPEVQLGCYLRCYLGATCMCLQVAVMQAVKCRVSEVRVIAFLIYRTWFYLSLLKGTTGRLRMLFRLPGWKALKP